MDEPKTYFDKLSLQLKNNKFIAIAMIGTAVVGGIASFANSAKTLVSMAVVESRPAINGEWRAQVTYDWPNANYTETFSLDGEGEKINGSASFLRVKRGIVEGSVKGGKLEFTTKTQEAVGDATREVTHRYTGSLSASADEIRFVMQTDGSASAHVPVAFVARRAASAPPTSAPPASKP
jgi:hypothetical protein